MITRARTISRGWVHRGLASFVATALVALSACAPAPGPPVSAAPRARANEVVLYLGGAERQVETDDQRAEIVRALEDLRTLSPDALGLARYADYAMQPGRWTLAELIQHYFVPASTRSIDPNRFYQDAQLPSARRVVAEHIEAIAEDRQARELP